MLAFTKIRNIVVVLITSATSSATLCTKQRSQPMTSLEVTLKSTWSYGDGSQDDSSMKEFQNGIEKIVKLFGSLNDAKECQHPEPAQCEKSVLDSYDWFTETFPASNTFDFDCDDMNSSSLDENSISWWIGPDKRSWQNAFIVVDLGCQRCVSEIQVANSPNGMNNDRGTNEFLVSLSSEDEPDKWEPVVRGQLDDVRNLACADQPGKVEFAFESRLARYLRFEAISFYGRGPALQFLGIN